MFCSEIYLFRHANSDHITYRISNIEQHTPKGMQGKQKQFEIISNWNFCISTNGAWMESEYASECFCVLHEMYSQYSEHNIGVANCIFTIMIDWKLNCLAKTSCTPVHIPHRLAHSIRNAFPTRSEFVLGRHFHTYAVYGKMLSLSIILYDPLLCRMELIFPGYVGVCVSVMYRCVYAFAWLRRKKKKATSEK